MRFDLERSVYNVRDNLIRAARRDRERHSRANEERPGLYCAELSDPEPMLDDLCSEVVDRGPFPRHQPSGERSQSPQPVVIHRVQTSYPAVVVRAQPSKKTVTLLEPL
jgi:hypothetical protein